MTNFNYVKNRPNGPDNPSADYPDMKINTNSSFDIWDIDHIGFKQKNGGYHNIIHQVLQLVDPVAIAGINQVYAKNVTVNSVTDTQLFSMTGLGGISQLTGNTAQTNGYQWIGGMLIQWGFNSAVGAGTFAGGRAAGTVIYPIQFNTNTYFASAVPAYTSNTNSLASVNVPNSAATININTLNLSNTQFQWVFNSNSSDIVGFYWIAIGN